MNIDRMKALEIHAVKTAMAAVRDMPDTEEDFETSFFIASLLVNTVCALLSSRDHSARIQALEMVHDGAMEILRKGVPAKAQMDDAGFTLHLEH